MKTPEKLPLGRYLIEELQSPEGYYNDPAYAVEFEIKSDRVWQVVGNATNDMDEYIVTEKYCNHETLGQLTIRKLGNVLTDYQDGQFIYTQDNLAGTVYEIHAAADIATPDCQGTYWYKSGDLVATVTTGAEGQVDEVKFRPTRTQATYDFLKITHDGTKGEVTATLPLGKYTITEVQAPYGFVLTRQSYTVEFSWDNQKNDIVLAKTIVSHEQDGDKECSYSIVNVKDASDAHKTGQTLVFENARVLPVPEKPGDKVSKIGVGIYKQDREALTYLPGAVYTLTEDAAPAGFEIANSVQFKLETVDDGISLFVRENADAEWTRADKRLIQMIDEATPREDTPTPAPTPQPTPAATPVPTPAPAPVITPRKVQTLPQTGDGFPLLAIVVVSLASATGIVLLTVKQRNALKETSDKEDADESSDR